MIHWHKMTRTLALAVAANAVLPQPRIVRAEAVVTETANYYDVGGMTAREVRGAIDRLGPKDIDGSKQDAVSLWSVKWSYKYKTAAQGCAIAQASAGVDIQMTFPRLQMTAAMPTELKQAFARYADNLLVHEKGHQQNAINVANQIEANIPRLGTRPNCTVLGQDAEALAKSIIKDGIAWDADYDIRTKHGEAQGVRFP